MDDKKKNMQDILKEDFELNKKIIMNPKLPLKERAIAEKKVLSYLEVWGELYG